MGHKLCTNKHAQHMPTWLVVLIVFLVIGVVAAGIFIFIKWKTAPSVIEEVVEIDENGNRVIIENGDADMHKVMEARRRQRILLDGVENSNKKIERQEVKIEIRAEKAEEKALKNFERDKKREQMQRATEEAQAAQLQMMQNQTQLLMQQLETAQTQTLSQGEYMTQQGFTQQQMQQQMQEQAQQQMQQQMQRQMQEQMQQQMQQQKNPMSGVLPSAVPPPAVAAAMIGKSSMSSSSSMQHVPDMMTATLVDHDFSSRNQNENSMMNANDFLTNGEADFIVVTHRPTLLPVSSVHGENNEVEKQNFINSGDFNHEMNNNENDDLFGRRSVMFNMEKNHVKEYEKPGSLVITSAQFEMEIEASKVNHSASSAKSMVNPASNENYNSHEVESQLAGPRVNTMSVNYQNQDDTKFEIDQYNADFENEKDDILKSYVMPAPSDVVSRPSIGALTSISNDVYNPELAKHVFHMNQKQGGLGMMKGF
eukprot:GDKJ01023411.1.p1 GENE.GDKJ01023411.1~~GDKJ01023411.1.p1  ORF type:complete len:481 (+),score=128.07 GDKJ01023411.1:1-1443(+)